MRVIAVPVHLAWPGVPDQGSAGKDKGLLPGGIQQQQGCPFKLNSEGLQEAEEKIISSSCSSSLPLQALAALRC